MEPKIKNTNVASKKGNKKYFCLAKVKQLLLYRVVVIVQEWNLRGDFYQLEKKLWFGNLMLSSIIQIVCVL